MKFQIENPKPPFHVYNFAVPLDPNKQRARKAETIGLALIALAILIITLVRYWHFIHWNWR